MGAYTNLTYHVIFGTKCRKPSIRDDFRERLFEYMGGTIRGLKGHVLEIGGIEDHVHLLANLPPGKALSDMIRDIKANASGWTNELPDTVSKFEWQRGYSAFTVSYSGIGTVRHYIQNQKEHHRKKSFKEEYIEFLRRHDIPFDERFLFEGEYHG